MPWGAIAGAAIGYLGSQSASKRAANAARDAAAQTAFKPYNVYSGYGTGVFSGQNATGTLAPEYQQIRDSYLDRAGQQRGALSSYNPQEVAGDMYGKLLALSRQDEGEARLELENRLLAQGMLGSTGGASRIRGFEDAANNARLKREVTAYGMAQDDLDRMIAREMGYTQAASQLDALPMQLLDQGGVFGGRQSSAGQFGSELMFKAAQNRGDATAAFWSNLGSTLSPAIGQAVQSWRQPTSQYSTGAFGGQAYGGTDYFAP